MQGLKGWESKNTKVPWSTPSEPNGVSVSPGVFLYIFYIWLLSLYWTQILLVKIILNTETPCLFVVIVLLCLFSGSQEYLDTYKCQLYIPKKVGKTQESPAASSHPMPKLDVVFYLAHGTIGTNFIYAEVWNIWIFHVYKGLCFFIVCTYFIR